MSPLLEQREPNSHDKVLGTVKLPDGFCRDRILSQDSVAPNCKFQGTIHGGVICDYLDLVPSQAFAVNHLTYTDLETAKGDLQFARDAVSRLHHGFVKQRLEAALNDIDIEFQQRQQQQGQPGSASSEVRASN